MFVSGREGSDPFLNIAAEEYYIRHSDEDMCMIWTNTASVIIGKHQNAYAEINYPFVKARGIPVIRRISGGGAVYHDEGNINFSFIKKATGNYQVDFRQFTNVILSFIQSFGIDAHSNERNSLFVGKQKFSGNAEHVYRNKVLHHGTILFNSELEVLNEAIKPFRNFSGKAPASVRSEVGNLAPLLPPGMLVSQFSSQLINWLKEHYQSQSVYSKTEPEQQEIALLAEKKYKTWEWNFGYSPAYTFDIEINTNDYTVPLSIKVENGRITEIAAKVDSNARLPEKLLTALTGCRHEENEIRQIAQKNIALLELAGLNTVSFVNSFF